MRVFGISDIHTDWEENRRRLEALPLGPYSEDALLVAGDVSHDPRTFTETMSMLCQRFAHVFFVPGNHDVWVAASSAGGNGGPSDSLAKHRWLLEECARLGVWTTPVRYPLERLVIVPLLSWYHPEFDVEPDVPASALASASVAARRRRRVAMLGDEIGCVWPEQLQGDLALPRNRLLAELFDQANDHHSADRPVPPALAAALPRRPSVHAGVRAAARDHHPVSFAEALSSRQGGDSVISFSHFLPRLELLPEKRFLFYPQLAKASGSLPLRARLARLRPALHLFGHTHFAWDLLLDAGVRFIQAPLGSPREWSTRPRSLRLEGGLPALLWRGRRAAVPIPAQRAALWSDYYARHARQPASPEVGAWIKFGTGPRSRRRASEPKPASPSRATAALWLVWDIDRLPGPAQLSLLSPDEEARANRFTGTAARRRFVWMRAALRCILGEALGQSPLRLEFVYGAGGKPRLRALAATRRCSFNVTHSGGVGAVLLLNRAWDAAGAALPVGVDLERHRARRFSALARRFFLPAECKALAAAAETSAAAEAQVFFDMWTKKEAWLKALGVGLAGGLDSLDCSQGSNVEAIVDGATPRAYSVSAVHGLPLEAHSLAVALPKGTALRFESLSSVGWPHMLRGAGVRVG